MALKKIDAEILWAERDPELPEVLAGVRCRFETTGDQGTNYETAIAVVRARFRTNASQQRIDRRVFIAAWSQIETCFADTRLETNLFADLWDAPEDDGKDDDIRSSLSAEQEASLQRDLDDILSQQVPDRHYKQVRG